MQLLSRDCWVVKSPILKPLNAHCFLLFPQKRSQRETDCEEEEERTCQASRTSRRRIRSPTISLVRLISISKSKARFVVSFQSILTEESMWFFWLFGMMLLLLFKFLHVGCLILDYCIWDLFDCCDGICFCCFREF